MHGSNIGDGDCFKMFSKLAEGFAVTVAAQVASFALIEFRGVVDNETFRSGSLTLRNTAVQEILAKPSTICESSFAKGGPPSIVIRLLTVPAPLHGPSIRA